ncbi:hypothetical protein CDL15_Pgr021387 [Punica granatum]|uniref:BHLH domain-containing protein n=1 Tax=Punica granatum TaxID=22663 RepID=A0A218WQX7_PUNGR|nr:hypothetical protein CDL15_Pgr021387 [Punica granatum]
MNYCNTLDPPLNCTMNINGGVSSSPCFHDQPSKSSSESFDVTIDTLPSSNYSTEDSFLHPTSHITNVVGTLLPYPNGTEHYFPIHGCPSDKLIRQTIHKSKHSVPCIPELLSRTPTWAVPSFWLDSNFPVLDFSSEAPASSWSSFDLSDHIRQNLSAPKSLCTYPHKVRKEKLGDRVAALQQLVAPYGKTDTASVLTEAIGYIKFLQDQVEVLREDNNGSIEWKGDLRRQGLCLVPLSCLSHIDFDSCGGPIFNWTFPRVA